MKEEKSYFPANMLSWAFHPLLMPTYGLFLVFTFNVYFRFSIPPVLKWVTYLIVCISTFLLPSIAALGMVRSGIIKSLQMESREDRQAPFLVTAAFYIVCYYLLTQLHLPKIFLSMMLGACISVILALIINFWWKISIHTIGMGGLCGIVYALSQSLFVDMVMPFSFLVLLSGFVASARMFVGSHQPAQIYMGFILGFIAECISMGF